MQTSKIVPIGKKKYKVISIPPTMALEYYFTLQKYALGPAGETLKQALASTDKKDKPLSEAELTKENVLQKILVNVDLGTILTKLANTIEPKVLSGLFKNLITDGATHADDSTIIYEEEFIGEIKTVFGLVSEVVSHNYPNFFGMLFDLIKVNPTDSTPEK